MGWEETGSEPSRRSNVAGTESEVHVFALGKTSDEVCPASKLVLKAIIKRAGMESCRRCDSLGCPKSEFLSNGARCYIDHGYLEYSTPPTASTITAVAAVRAGDVIVERAVSEAAAKLSGGMRLRAVRNTCDHRGHSYAAHVNVSMRRPSFDRLMNEEGTLLHETVGPLIVSLSLVCGAGRAGSNKGEDLFQIWERSEYLERDKGALTTSDRAILNTRDEPLADADQHARLHVIAFDANRLETPQYLKQGVMRLLCASLDLDVPTAVVPLADLVEAAHLVSRRPFSPLRLTNGKTITALEIQRVFWHALKRRSTRLAERVPDAGEILHTWDGVLKLLEHDPLELVGILDWPTKYALLEAARARDNMKWNDPRLAWVDINYHSLTGGGRTADGVVDRGRVTTDEGIRALVAAPPPHSRASVRVALVGRFGEQVANCDWHWLEGKDGRRFMLGDPSGGEADATARIDRASSLDGACRGLDLREKPAVSLYCISVADEMSGDDDEGEATRNP